jgi:SAM-dependent methyltransferase
LLGRQYNAVTKELSFLIADQGEMKRQLLEWLACPSCNSALSVDDNPGGQVPLRDGALLCSACSSSFSIRGFIPRFVNSESYAASFGFEWRQFQKTQLDSENGRLESEQRFKESLDFPIGELRGKLILDAGCGMGRFMEVGLKYGATVIGVDMTRAADAAYENVGLYSQGHLIQADLSRLPLRKGIFDFIYCLGVLHHTPGPKDVFKKLIGFLKPGGKISITVYSGYNKVYVSSTNLWRRVTTKLPQRLVYMACHLAIPLYYIYRIPVLGKIGSAFWPISLHPHAEWRVLDTFDCYTPEYQFYYTHFEVYRWFLEAGLTEIAVLEPGVSFIGTRPPDVAVAR